MADMDEIKELREEIAKLRERIAVLEAKKPEALDLAKISEDFKRMNQQSQAAQAHQWHADQFRTGQWFLGVPTHGSGAVC